MMHMEAGKSHLRILDRTVSKWSFTLPTGILPNAIQNQRLYFAGLELD